MEFNQLMEKLRGRTFSPPPLLLCLDPGHSTGWSLFREGKLIDCGELTTVINRKGNNEGDIDWSCIHELILDTKPTHIICEDYRVYGHKLDRHSNSKVLTIRLIGMIDYVAWLNDYTIRYQMANVHKGFCTDDKLKTWGYWDVKSRHARDSIRAGCYYLLFNKELV